MNRPFCGCVGEFILIKLELIAGFIEKVISVFIAQFNQLMHQAFLAKISSNLSTLNLLEKSVF